MAKHSNLKIFPGLNAKILNSAFKKYNENDPDEFNEIVPHRPYVRSPYNALGETHLIASPPTKAELTDRLLTLAKNSSHNPDDVYSARGAYAADNETAIKLLFDGANSNFQDSIGNTALHYACEIGENAALILTLLGATANITIKNNKGFTPIDLYKKWADNYQEERSKVVRDAFAQRTKSKSWFGGWFGGRRSKRTRRRRSSTKRSSTKRSSTKRSSTKRSSKR